MRINKKKIVLILNIILILALCFAVLIYYRKNKYARIIKPTVEISTDNAVCFYQNDDLWKDEPLGNSKYNMGNSGCLTSCIASALVMQKINIDEIPEIDAGTLNSFFNDYNKNLTVYDDEGNIMWSRVQDALELTFYTYTSYDISAKELENLLLNKIYPIVKVKTKSGNSHFVLLAGSDGNDFLCIDPMNKDRNIVSLSDYDNTIYSVRYFCEGMSEEESDILCELKKAEIISPDDRYMGYQRDVGLFGPEGDYRYIYRRTDGKDYYVSLYNVGNCDYWDYKYKNGDTVYRIDIQDCEYNENAEYPDERIKNPDGDYTYYLVVKNKSGCQIIPHYFIEQSETLAVETTEKVTETENVLETTQVTTIPSATISKAKKLNLGEIDKYSLEHFTYNRFIYFTDYGRYYEVEIGGRQSANYVWCYDSGDGEPKILTETEDSTIIYCDENSAYISKYLWHDNKYLLYRLENDNMIAIDELPFDCDKYYIGNYAYYSIRNDDVITVYRMEQGKSTPETIIDLPENVESYTIYDNKIWYDYNNRQGISYYDLTTGETESFDKGKIGIINNGYMYYAYYEESDKLLRFNLSSHEYEIVCETEDNKHLFAFDFHKDYILYCSGSCLYKINDDENTLIFSTENFFENEGYEIRNIQCQDNRIFLKIGSGAFYQCIMEIDIDGNIVEVIHED